MVSLGVVEHNGKLCGREGHELEVAKYKWVVTEGENSGCKFRIIGSKWNITRSQSKTYVLILYNWGVPTPKQYASSKENYGPKKN